MSGTVLGAKDSGKKTDIVLSPMELSIKLEK